jgi:hypothetical protein
MRVGIGYFHFKQLLSVPLLKDGEMWVLLTKKKRCLSCLQVTWPAPWRPCILHSRINSPLNGPAQPPGVGGGASKALKKIIVQSIYSIIIIYNRK